MHVASDAMTAQLLYNTVVFKKQPERRYIQNIKLKRKGTMELGLKDKVALITGAGSQIGFGKGIAMTLAREGCDIIVGDIDLKGAEQTANELRALGRKAIALKADVTSSTEVNEMVKAALAEFGRIDILVNNAGVGTPPKPFVESNEAEWDLGININLRGVMNCTKAVLPHMISRQSGKIVSMASIAGLAGTRTGTIYGAAKAGVVNFTAGLALEVAELGINVNCIAPGLGATSFHPASGFPPEYIENVKKMAAEGKTTTPEDIGNAVAFLVSDVSIRIVGQCLRVSGTL
jgi:NAD(P)-dependent dehydrogenase (short-subunit alcohol dehydrogenase family)